MDNLPAYLMLKDVPQDYRVELPDFPLGWLDKEKRNIEGLREIASHLHGKTAAGRSSRDGFKGVATEMEKQLYQKCDRIRATGLCPQRCTPIRDSNHCHRT